MKLGLQRSGTSASGASHGSTRGRRATDIPSETARALLDWLPQGRLLPERSWRRRHQAITIVLWLHAIALTGFGLYRGYGLVHSLLDALLVAVPAALATVGRLGRRFRMLAASFGLITASALLVHLSGGLIESHFHFFVVIPILILYQDWSPFLLALVYVVFHHGALGVLDPSGVYNHPAAIDDPWTWAIVHGAFVLAASATNVVSWRANEQMLHEPLTGLPGRGVFLHRVELALERRRRRDSIVAVLFLDLNRFKLLNDTLGHAVGDELLVATADRLRATVRGTDTVARLGGDEFAVLCEDVAGQREVTMIAERIERALAQPFPLAASEVVSGASIGIAVASSALTTRDDLIANADTAMYRAKMRPGTPWVFFDEAMRSEDATRLAIEAALRQALSRDEFRIAYQPIVTRADGVIVGAEALLRWEHDGSPISPGEFIPIAEQTGLIVPIGRWVLEQACLEAATWPVSPGAGHAPYVTVNLSPRQFAQPGLPESVAEALAASGLEPERLGLEITESVLMDEVEASLETLSALKRLGVRLLLDDFGTGYSSLSYLTRFPIDVVKVDRSFVARLGEQLDEGAILAAVAGMADALGMSAVAEGVETVEQVERLGVLGYDLAQGFCFARPGPAGEFRQLLADQGSCAEAADAVPVGAAAA